MWFLHDIHFKKSSFFSNLCTFLWALHPPVPPLPYVTFWRITLLFLNMQVSIFWYLKEQKITLNIIPNMPWYVKYFGVKRNYIVIFEKLCNSSTLLMELFMICGLLLEESERDFINVSVTCSDKQGNYVTWNSRGMWHSLPQWYLPEWQEEEEEQAFVHGGSSGLNYLRIYPWYMIIFSSLWSVASSSSCHSGRWHCGIKWHILLLSWVA